MISWGVDMGTMCLQMVLMESLRVEMKFSQLQLGTRLSFPFVCTYFFFISQGPRSTDGPRTSPKFALEGSRALKGG
jgi:hypothetical protein